MDLIWIVKHRDQLWAEAYHRVVNERVIIRLDPALYDQAARQQERRRIDDPWEPLLAQNFPSGLVEHERITPNQVFGALLLTTQRLDTRDMRRINQILQAQGFRRMTVIDRGPEGDGTPVRVMGWGRDAPKSGQLTLPTETTTGQDTEDE
jgi:hypothetical protein